MPISDSSLLGNYELTLLECVRLTFYKKTLIKNFELYLAVKKKAVSLQRSNKNKLKDDMKQEKLNSLIISLNIILLWGQDRK